MPAMATGWKGGPPSARPVVSFAMTKNGEGKHSLAAAIVLAQKRNLWKNQRDFAAHL